MKIRWIPLLIVCLLATAAVVDAQQLVVKPDPNAARGPVFAYPNGVYSPYPGIWAPVPYPGWGYPPHWIYSYMFTGPADRRFGRDREYEGKTYPGRDTLYPAVPYSDYLKNQKDLLKSHEVAAKPAPTPDKALLEIRLPHEKAKLYFDGKEAPGDGQVRVFLTPSLKAGETYTFKLKTTWLGPLPELDLTNEQSISFRANEHKIVDMNPKE